MPNRVKDKNNTLLVKFYDDVADQEVHSMLAWMGISGIRVSSFVKRWAVEVPYWREGEYLEKFYRHELVEAVHDSFNKSEPLEEGENEQP